MTSVAAACVAVIVLGAGEQLVVHGWTTFITRPAGVGASEDAASSTDAGTAVQEAEAAPAPARPDETTTTTTTSPPAAAPTRPRTDPPSPPARPRRPPPRRAAPPRRADRS